MWRWGDRGFSQPSLFGLGSDMLFWADPLGPYTRVSTCFLSFCCCLLLFLSHFNTASLTFTSKIQENLAIFTYWHVVWLHLQGSPFWQASICSPLPSHGMTVFGLWNTYTHTVNKKFAKWLSRQLMMFKKQSWTHVLNIVQSSLKSRSRSVTVDGSELGESWLIVYEVSLAYTPLCLRNGAKRTDLTLLTPTTPTTAQESDPYPAIAFFINL